MGTVSVLWALWTATQNYDNVLHFWTFYEWKWRYMNSNYYHYYYNNIIIIIIIIIIIFIIIITWAKQIFPIFLILNKYHTPFFSAIISG